MVEIGNYELQIGEINIQANVQCLYLDLHRGCGQVMMQEHREGIGSNSANAWDPWVDIASKESKRSQISTIVDSWEYTGKESSMVEV